MDPSLCCKWHPCSCQQKEEVSKRQQAALLLNITLSQLQNRLTIFWSELLESQGYLGSVCLTCTPVSPWYARYDMAKPLIPYDTVCIVKIGTLRIGVPQVPPNAVCWAPLLLPSRTGAWINDPDPVLARVSWFNKMEQCKSVQFCCCYFPIPSEQFNYVMNRCGSLELEEDITRGR